MFEVVVLLYNVSSGMQVGMSRGVWACLSPGIQLMLGSKEGF
jgi:hypothetical protein